MLDQRAEITHAAFNARAKRKRSIKAFLPISLTGRATSSPTAFNPKTAGSVPADVVLEIAELLAPIDVLNFSLTSKYLRTLLLPSLYETILLKSSRKCRSTLPMLAKHPEICACIRKLAVRPNYYLSWPKADDPLDEDWVVTQIEGIAPTLKGLHTFDWDGLEMPADRLWQTLQRCCPQLKTVFSNVGCKPLNPDSHLFSFKGLTSFSLIVRHGLAGTDLFPPLEHLPEQMWTMLLDHSPNLEELTLCSFSSSSRLFDIEPITQGSWPSLNTLTLGSFGYHQNFTLTPPATAPEFGAFLSAHTALKYLRLSWNFKRWMSPESIPMHLAPSALPNLDSFIGVYQQLAELPDECCKRIENLDLTCEPVYESRVQIVSPLLRRLTELKSLDVWVHVPNPEEQDHSQFFREIVGACPGLTELHFMCTTPFPAKPLKQLSTLLRLLPNLKTFSLTKGHKYRDDTMLQNALQIIRDNQNLKQVNIRWAREKSPNHLKQEGTYDVEKVVSGPGGEASVTAVAASTTTTTMVGTKNVYAEAQCSCGCSLSAGTSVGSSTGAGTSTWVASSSSSSSSVPSSSKLASGSGSGSGGSSLHLRRPSSTSFATTNSNSNGNNNNSASSSELQRIYDEALVNAPPYVSDCSVLYSPISSVSSSTAFSFFQGSSGSGSSSGLGIGSSSGSSSGLGLGIGSSLGGGGSSGGFSLGPGPSMSSGSSSSSSSGSSSSSSATIVRCSSCRHYHDTQPHPHPTSFTSTSASTSTSITYAPAPAPHLPPPPLLSPSTSSSSKNRIVLTITAHERGIPLLGRPFVKKYKHELVIPLPDPPHGYGGRVQTRGQGQIQGQGQGQSGAGGVGGVAAGGQQHQGLRRRRSLWGGLGGGGSGGGNANANANANANTNASANANGNGNGGNGGSGSLRRRSMVWIGASRRFLSINEGP